MLRSNLFKRFSKKKFEDAGTVTKPEETGLSIPTVEDIKKNFGINNPFVLDGYTTPEQPKGTVSTTESSFAPGTFSDLVKSPMFTTGFSPLNPYDINPKTPEPEQGPMTKEQSDYFVLDQSMPETKTPETKEDNRPAMVSLGLLGFNALLGKNEDLKNQQQFIESIQQRNSKPINDYNFMYGRTTSGGTEYQPVIKAEMGAKINKRYASEGMNDVEIEGGEFIQLPNFETEMAEGPSHENGGIPTNLPDETRVYSNNLKPEGSKKTFAQIAKNYDITSYKKTLENPFAKQVDKDTAGLMMKRNQKILDDLFRDQQILNGNSNGEVEAKNGADINNPGFKALPGYVQAKITANMKDGGKKNPQPDVTSLPPQIRNYAKWDPTFQKKDGSVGAYRLEVPAGLDQDALTGIARAAESYGISNLVQTANTRMQGAPGIKGFHSGLSPQDFEKKIVAESLGKEAASKLNELDTRKKAFELMGVDTEGYDVNDASKLYADDYFREKAFYPAFQKYLPQGKFRAQEGDDKMFGFEHYDAIKAKTPPGEKPKDPGKDVDGGTPVGEVGKPVTGKYTRGQFPLYQAIPEAMGLAQAEEIYSYAIPEVDKPYITPQTLNIQSELQDIDNMGTAAMRSGADPNMTYIAGLDAKQRIFEKKQNFDVQGRSQTDLANAQMSMQADQFNAQAFDRVYNTLVGQARDAQSGEKLAAIASLTEKKGKFEQDENLKAMGIPIVAPGYDVTSTGDMSLPANMKAAFDYYNYMKDQDAKATKTAKKGMYKKPKN